MRNSADARSAPAAGAGKTAAASRRRPAGKSTGALNTPGQGSPREAASITVTTVRMLRVDEGLYALRVGAIAGGSSEISGMAVPAAQVCAPLAEDGNGVEIIASFPGRGPWLDKAGGTVILRSPIGGGHVIVTVYGGSEPPESALSLDLQRLDDPGQAAAEAAPTVAPPTGGATRAAGEVREVPTEILLHIERAGDRLFPGRGWVGALGRRIRIEAFSIKPLERLRPAELEMKGFLPNGGETPWVPGGVLCGTRGRGLPLTGFAVRVAAQAADRFQVSYQGSFFAEGISRMQQNGAPCRAGIADDPLEAINVRVIERLVDAEPGPTAS